MNTQTGWLSKGWIHIGVGEKPEYRHGSVAYDNAIEAWQSSLSSAVKYEAIGWLEGKEGVVEFELRETNHRYEGLSDFSGPIYNHDTVAIPVKQPEPNSAYANDKTPVMKVEDQPADIPGTGKEGDKWSVLIFQLSVYMGARMTDDKKPMTFWANDIVENVLKPFVKDLSHPAPSLPTINGNTKPQDLELPERPELIPFIEFLKGENKFHIEEVRKWLNYYLSESISFSRFVELFNEKIFLQQSKHLPTIEQDETIVRLSRENTKLISEVEELRETHRRREEWLRDAKKAAGANYNESFDNVWKRCLDAYLAASSLPGITQMQEAIDRAAKIMDEKDAEIQKLKSLPDMKEIVGKLRAANPYEKIEGSVNYSLWNSYNAACDNLELLIDKM